MVRLEYLQNALESLVNNIKSHLCFYSTPFLSLSCLQRSFVTTLHQWNLGLHHVQTFSAIRIFIAAQCLGPSDPRSSWSEWRNMVVTVLEIDIAKSLPRLGLAWIVIHFFSFLGSIEALFGTRLRKLAPVSPVLEATQVSLEPVFTSLC